LIGTYRTAYIPGLSTSGVSGVGEITYDGSGRLCGRDEYSTFDGTYSVNPDGSGTSTKLIRILDSQEIFPRVMRAIGSFKIHPGGGIEFETSSTMRFGKTVGTQHQLEPQS
jgi:hypothetical protein